MKKQKVSETQILKALKEYEAGKNTIDICRELGKHKATVLIKYQELLLRRRGKTNKRG